MPEKLTELSENVAVLSALVKSLDYRVSKLVDTRPDIIKEQALIKLEMESIKNTLKEIKDASWFSKGIDLIKVLLTAKNIWYIVVIGIMIAFVATVLYFVIWQDGLLLFFPTKEITP